MNRWIDRGCRVLESVIALCLAIMVVLVFGNVVLRYGFNSGITVSEEISRWLFIWGTFLGAVVAMKEHGHLGMDMVVQRLPAWGKRLCLLVSHGLMLFVVWLLFKGGWQQAQINLEVSAPTTGAPMAIVYGASVVFAVLAAVILALDLYRILTNQLSDGELIMVQESEESVQLHQILKDAPAGEEKQ